MYFLVREDGLQVPIIVIEQDSSSVKISNLSGDVRWLRYTDFILKDNLFILKN